MFKQVERGIAVVKHQVSSNFCATLYKYSKLCLRLSRLV